MPLDEMTVAQHSARETERLLDAVEAAIRRYVVLTDDQYAAVTAWTLHTYCWQISDCTPYLIVTSAEKGSGKTRLMEVLAKLVHRPNMIQSPTEAVLFRMIDARRPTLFIDETDTIFKDGNGGPSERQEALRAVINGGFRSSGTVARLTPGMELVEFSTFCPKVLAGIGHLPETIEHRGIPIRLVRKDVAVEVERFRERDAERDLAPLRRDIEGWGSLATIHLDGVYPDMPAGLDDRAQDMYELMVAIGDFAGERWSVRLREALVRLRTGQVGADASPGVRLLHDLSLIDLSGREMIPTPELLGLLYAEGEQPYEDWWGEATGKKAALRLSKLLGEYGVKPQQFWADGKKWRGYNVAEVSAEVARYAFQTVDTVVSCKSALSDTVGGEVSYRVENRRFWLEQSVLPSLPPFPGDAPSSGPLKGSPEWLAQASMDELLEFYDAEDSP